MRWYLRFRLSYADLAELVAERCVSVDSSGVFDWVHHVTPFSQDADVPHRHRVGGRWSVDETYIGMAGTWVYAYRAIDECGQVIDVSGSENRDTGAATSFLQQAVERTATQPETVPTDTAPAYPPALRAAIPEAAHGTGKLEQQAIERAHHHLKGRIRGMRGFQQLSCVQVVCQGHAFVRTLQEGFYRLARLFSDPRICQPPRLVRAWDEVAACLRAA